MHRHLRESRQTRYAASMSARFLCLLVAALVLPTVAHSAEKDEAALKKRLDQLEEDNAKLKAQLAKANADTKKLFDASTKAEKSAGLDFRRPTAVAAQSAPAGVPPVSQAPTRHATVRFQHAELDMNVSFAPSRSIRTWRVHDAVCDVTKKSR